MNMMEHGHPMDINGINLTDRFHDCFREVIILDSHPEALLICARECGCGWTQHPVSAGKLRGCWQMGVY